MKDTICNPQRRALRWTTALVSLGVLALPAAPAFADDAAAQATAPGDDAGSDIIVTARRRDERAQDVPIALSVVDGGTLARTNSYNLEQVMQLVPSLNVQTGNRRNSALSVRGLGGNQAVANDGLEPGVGVYVDDVYYARPAQIFFELYDVDRIEVLRGPQGTLFGKNTVAGAINITSKAPSFDPEFKAETSLGSYDFRQFRGALTGPLVDGLAAFRVSGSVTRRDGYIRNLTDDSRVNNTDDNSVRGQLLITPAPALRVLLTADYSRSIGRCCNSSVIGTITTLANGAPLPNNAVDRAARVGYVLPFDPSARTVEINTPPVKRFLMWQWGVSGKADWDLGPVTLTSVTAYRDWNWSPRNDADGIGLPIITVSDTLSEQKQFSQELRVASNGDGPISYIGGLYYFHQSIDSLALLEYGAAAPNWLLGSNSAINDLAVNGFRTESPSVMKNDSFAAFGQATWSVTDRLKLTGGLRYTYEKKTGTFAQTARGQSLAGQSATVVATVNAIRAGFGRDFGYDARISGGNLSGQVNLAYQFAPDVLGYATYSRGFKAGGLNLATIPAGGSVRIDPEHANNYEIGFKSSWFDRRLTANAALFIEEIKGYQASLLNLQTNSSYIANVGKVRSRGGEIDIQARPVDGLSLYASAAYTDAKSVSYPSGPCPIELRGLQTSCNFSGRDLPNVSKWTVSAGGEQRWALGDWQGHGVELFVAGDFAYRSAFNASPDLSVYTKVPGYGLFNAQAGIRLDKGLQLSVWGKNIFDKQYYRSISTFLATSSGLVGGAIGDPRTFGGTLSFTY